MKIFYVTKWILRSFLFLLLLDLIVESAVVVPNQKGNQDGTKLSEQRFLPETLPALYVEEENHAPKLTQISRKRVKKQAPVPALGPRIPVPKCGRKSFINRCNCPCSSPSPMLSASDIGCSVVKAAKIKTTCCKKNNDREPCKNNWINQTCPVHLQQKCKLKLEQQQRQKPLSFIKLCKNLLKRFGCLQ
ncbi:uncharacterized protein LOC143452789 [Clavelina lepadiformis]|uniref:uncharacterized protein LOC143452789 n=1 Tax=Clavelina lepadiformis TaxID=159417 RepID=UPI0040432C4C